MKEIQNVSYFNFIIFDSLELTTQAKMSGWS